MLLANQGSDKLAVDLNGNVGIGTTSPSEKLHIEASDPRIKIVDTDGTNWESEVFTQGGALKLQARNGTNFGNISFQGDNGTTQSEYARFNSVGNFGIGTTSPGAKLDIIGSAIGLRVKKSDLSDVLRVYSQGSGIYMNNGNVHISDNLGIGTTSPAYKLEVFGDIRTKNEFLWGNNNNSPVGRLYAGGQTAVLLNTSTDGFVQISGGNTTSNGGNIGLSGSTNADPNTIKFRIGGGEVMRVAANTNVGIGTTSPLSKLNVNGDIKIEGENELYFGSSGSVPLWEIKASGSDLVINDTGSNVGSVLFNNDEGVVLPRLTTTEINAISLPNTGLTVYNTTLNTLCFYNGSSWQKVSHTNM